MRKHLIARNLTLKSNPNTVASKPKTLE